MRKVLLFALVGSALAVLLWWKGPVSAPAEREAGKRGASPASTDAAPVDGPVVRFESTPAGAAVTGPDGLLGTTPFDHALKGGDPPKSVVFSLKGHFTRQLNVEAKERLVRVDLLKK